MKLNQYLRLWFKTASLSSQVRTITWGASLMYLMGKFIRFGFFLATIIIVLNQTKTLKGYNLNQMMVFFLMFELLDILGQLFYRGIYLFRHQVITGLFDFTLMKPVNELFLTMTNQLDILDLPLLAVVIFLFTKLDITITISNSLLFILISLCGFLIVTAIHITVAAVGLLTTEVDNLLMIYRDLSLMAKVPVDIYLPAVRFILTFILPMALIFTFPAKALMGILSWQWIIYSITASLISFLASLKLWSFALTKYSSASS